MFFFKFRSFVAFTGIFGVFLVFLQVWFAEWSEEGEVLRDETVVLWWTPFGAIEGSRKCGDAACYFTQKRKYLQHRNLKAVLFYGSNVEINDLPLPRGSDVRWGLFHEESPKNNLIFVNENVLRLFNYSATFSRYSDVPLTLLDLPGERELLDKQYFLPTSEKNRLMKEKNLSPLLYLQSNCDSMSDRDSYISELMKHVSVDSYGNCLNNRELPKHLKTNYIGNLNSKELKKFVGMYKFTLAFENAVCEDYITEKLWRPLIAGSVPVYHGSPSFRDWLPNNSSAVAVQDFESPKDLAEFIKALAENDADYEKYLRHKLDENGVTNEKLLENLRQRPEELFSVFEHHLRRFECTVCEKLHGNGERMVTGKEYNCEKPRNNWWSDAWDMEKCTGGLLTEYLSRNEAVELEGFNVEKMKMYFDKRC